MRVFKTLLALALCAAPLAAQTPTIIFMVRHAEKAATPANDPPLTTAGMARAGALAEALSNAGVSAIISTPYARTKTTAAPLAAKLGVEVTTIPMSGTPAAHAQAVAEAVKKLAGKAILIVGHSNTINVIAAALGGPKLPDLCDGDYDQLYTLELMPTGPPRFVRSRYGARAVDPGCEAMR
jgi:phosphohistidine phosphatase SixA